MFRLSRQADYGILLLAEIASGVSQSVHAAPDLAAITGLPVPMVSKTLKVLAREGLLESTRGPRGGYTLARRAEDISVADIVIALEGPIAMTACADGGSDDCGLESRCRVQENWQKLNRVVIGALSRLSLAEMTQSEPPRLVMLEELSRPGSSLSRSGPELSRPGAELSRPGAELSRPGGELSRPGGVPQRG